MKAFPSPHDPKTGTMQLGMELRDYFAAQAMQAFLSNSHERPNFTRCEVAEFAYKMADAMMGAREE